MERGVRVLWGVGRMCLSSWGFRNWEACHWELSPWWGGLPPWNCMIFFPFPLPQLMQQQAALMASVAQGGYLNPMAAFAAAQMQQMAALNMNGLAAAPMTPTSGEWAGANAGPSQKENSSSQAEILATNGPSCGKNTWCLGPSRLHPPALCLKKVLWGPKGRWNVGPMLSVIQFQGGKNFPQVI